MRVRNEHWELLLELFENNPQLVTGKFNGVEGKAKGASLWRNVATKLNSLGFGEKSVDGWRKAITDWKSKTKSKAAAFKKELEKTGGGPILLPPLSKLEERLISIMGNKTVIGDDVPELGFGEAYVANHEIEVSMNEFVPQGLETETISQYSSDHDYLELSNNPSGSSSHPSQLGKKRHLETSTLKPPASEPPRKQAKTRRRRSQQVHLSSELLKLNKDTTFLGNISNNTERIANNLESNAHDIQIIAKFLQNK